MIDRRLHGERWMVPARLYARPLTLHPGMALNAEGLLKILNGLKYDQRTDVPREAGEFVAGESMVAFYPRPSRGAPEEAIVVLIEKPPRPARAAKDAPPEPERVK